MDAERWRRVEQLFHSALEHDAPARQAFLDRACSDADLRRDVLALLEQSPDGLLDRPAAALVAGALLGPYRILAPIGAGGMGTVYKALDTRLDRTVAIKFSNARFSERFEREARAIAALNHPHICTLYDAGPNYLVMEYVEGKTLSGPMPVEQAIALAGQLLDALDAAHRKSIVHRDLKPANILVTKSGVKVLDFGLAKMQAAAAAGSQTLTEKGSISGTLQYMSPEQVEGKDTDTRTDIFSFGLVFYEMLTGRRPFEGDSAARVMAGILEREPTPMGNAAPPGLERIVRRCLAKDPADRWQSVRDLKIAIEWSTPSEARQTRTPANRSVRWIAAAGIAAAALLAAFVYRPGPPAAETSRFTIAPPTGAAVDRAMEYTMLPLAVSPDGRHLAFTGFYEGSLWLWVRPLASEQAVRLDNTRGAAMPFWSPDSQQIAFFAPLPVESAKRTWQLKRIPAGGGSPELICDTRNADGGTWNRDGTILFAGGNSPVYRVAASGGQPAAVTALDAAHGETSHSMPEFLPDGRHFLFWANNSDTEKRAIWAGSLDTPDRHMVVLNDGMPGFAAPDRMLFSRDGTLYAQRLDMKRFQLLSKPVRIGENVHNLRRAFSASANGVLVYRETGPSAAQGSELVWYSRQGKRLGAIGERMPYREVRLSPNERYVALDAVMNKGTSIFLLDLQTNVTSRLSSNERNDDDPVWSPDSRSIVYVNHSGGPDTDEPASLWQLKLGEPAPKKLLEERGTWVTPADWSPHGEFLVLFRKNRSIHTFPLDTSHNPAKLLEVDPPTFVDEAHLSPDGRWIAYQARESGTWRVFVAAFPSMSGKKQVSGENACIPFWRKDGRELFYMSSTGRMMSVAVKPGAELDVSAPVVLFQGPSNPLAAFDWYAPSGDGQKFLIIEPSVPVAQDLHVVLHWDAGMGR